MAYVLGNKIVKDTKEFDDRKDKENEFKDLWIANPFTGESCDSSS
jgi:ribosomal protein L20